MKKDRLTYWEWLDDEVDMSRVPCCDLFDLDNIPEEERDGVEKLLRRCAELEDDDGSVEVEVEVLQRDVENLTRTLEEANDEIKALEAENAELKAKLEKAEKALGLACWEMALLDINCQGCDNEGNCRTMFLDGGYKLKTNECERYWLNKAEQRLAELQKEAQKMKVTTCKSCGAKIVWIKTQNGRSMPCDAEQVEYQKNYRGSALVVTQDGEVVRGNIIKDGGSALVPTVDGIGYISHFATCPNADKHRRTRRNEKEAK